MLNVRYDPSSRVGFVRLREGKPARTQRLSPQATAEYDRRGRLLTVTVAELDPTAAEFLRTSDEATLLRVIRMHGRLAREEPPREPGVRGRRV
jgi:hypothetical protein